MLAIGVLREHSIDIALVCPRLVVVDECVRLGRGRRQAGQVESHPTSEGISIRLAGRLESQLFQFGQHKPIHGRLHPRGVFDRRKFRSFDGSVRPVFFVVGALLNPLLQQRHLTGGQFFARSRGRHHFARLRRGNPTHQRTRFGFAGHDGKMILEFGPRPLGRVETQIGLAFLLVRTVAEVTVVGEDRPDVAIEIDRGGAANAGPHQKPEHSGEKQLAELHWRTR